MALWWLLLDNQNVWFQVVFESHPLTILVTSQANLDIKSNLSQGSTLMRLIGLELHLVRLSRMSFKQEWEI